MKRPNWLVPALLAAALAGCGGGGGGGGGTGGPPVTLGAPAPAPAVVITQANGPTVGAHGLDAAQDSSSASTAGLITGVQLQGTPDAGPLALTAIAQRMGAKVAGLQLASGVQDLRWGTTSDAPVAGQLKIVGLANTAVLLTFSGAGVTVQVDANGDGTYDSSTTSTVTQLRTLL